MKERLYRFFILLMKITTLLLFQSIPGWSETSAPQATGTPEELRKLKQEIQDLKDKVQHIDQHLIHRPESKEAARMFDTMKIGLGLTGIVQGSLDADDVAGEDLNDVSGSLDLEVQSEVGEHGTAFLLIESRQGEGLGGKIATLHGVNADAVEDQAEFKLTEAWYEQSVGEHLLFALGKIDLTNYFDANLVANDETLQFLSDGFVNNTAVEFPTDNGPGFRLAYLPSDRLEIGFGIGEADADFEDVNEGVFEILEFIYKSNLQSREGSYRLYLWTNRSDHVEWSNPTDDNEENWGFGVSLDQVLHEGVTGFFRAGIQDKSVSEVKLSISFGGKFRGLWPGRKKDTLGVALGYNRLSKDFEDSLAPLDMDHELMLEGYYTFHVNEQLLISPDIQIIRNPGGLDDADTIMTLGVRAQVFF